MEDAVKERALAAACACSARGEAWVMCSATRGEEHGPVHALVLPWLGQDSRPKERVWELVWLLVLNYGKEKREEEISGLSLAKE